MDTQRRRENYYRRSRDCGHLQWVLQRKNSRSEGEDSHSKLETGLSNVSFVLA